MPLNQMNGLSPRYVSANISLGEGCPVAVLLRQSYSANLAFIVV